MYVRETVVRTRANISNVTVLVAGGKLSCNFIDPLTLLIVSFSS